MCIAIFAEYSRVEDWKSGHRKLNSLFETFLIQDTMLDKILLSQEKINNYTAQGYGFDMKK